VSDSDGEEVSLSRPKRNRTAASKIVDPSNGSAFALTSHRDAAIAAQLAATAATKAIAGDSAASKSLSAIASTSNSHSVSPGKRNASNAALSSKSGSGSEVEEPSAQHKRTDKGKQKGEMLRSAMIFITESDVV
jgi:hypothetical protein